MWGKPRMGFLTPPGCAHLPYIASDTEEDNYTLAWDIFIIHKETGVVICGF